MNPIRSSFILCVLVGVLAASQVQAGGRGAKELVHDEYDSDEGGYGGDFGGDEEIEHGHSAGSGKHIHGHGGLSSENRHRKGAQGSNSQKLDASALADILEEPSQASREVLGDKPAGGLGGAGPLGLGDLGGLGGLIKKEEEKKDEKKEDGLAKGLDLLNPLKAGPQEIVKLFLNPIEFIKVISETFKLPLKGLVEKVGKGLILSTETIFNPIFVCLRAVEKLFVPDQCRFKFLCKIGASFAFAKHHLNHFSPEFLGISSVVRSFTSGALGQDCEVSFKHCDLKLKKPIEDLKHIEAINHQNHRHGHHSKGGLDGDYSRSLGEVKALASASLEKASEAASTNQSSKLPLASDNQQVANPSA